jgi:hypothetical protein
MNKLQLLEIGGIAFIIVVQFYIFAKTYARIKQYASIFPGGDVFFINKVKLLPQYWQLHPKELIANLGQYRKNSEPQIVQEEMVSEDGTVISPLLYAEDKREENELVDSTDKSNSTTVTILNSINTYLIRNKGIASDFHLIKDIVERNTDAREDEITQTISLPLYLGLLGTFIGIVLGLVQISGINFSGADTALDTAISTLLNGVMIAMVASFFGLLLTISNTGYFFKNAKKKVLDKKNEFYTFIQTDLLPLLTLYSLQNNLHKFNEEFSSNIGSLNKVMGKNYDALITQDKLLGKLETMNINSFAAANIKVLKELNFSVEKFSQFNQYLSQLNTLISESRGYGQQVNELLQRTDNFNELGLRIINSFGDNKQLLEFLQGHYNSLDESSQLINNAVGRVHNTLDETLDGLKEFVQIKIQEVQKLVNQEMEQLQHASPNKWKQLDNLSHLQKLGTDLQDIKMSSATQMEKMIQEVRGMNATVLELKNNHIKPSLYQRAKIWMLSKRK